MRHQKQHQILLFLLSLASLTAHSQSFEVIPLPAWHARAVSPDGSAVVGTSTGNQAYIWTEKDGLILLGTLPGHISSSGTDVATDGIAVIGSSDTRAYRWTPEGGMIELGRLQTVGGSPVSSGISADGTVVVGSSPRSGFGEEAVLWTEAGSPEGLGHLPGGRNSIATGVSANGNVIAGRSYITNRNHGFRWTAGSGMVAIGMCNPQGISADGNTIVGWFSNNGQREAFRWSASTGIVGLGHLPGHVSSEAFAVSGNGSVVVGRSRSMNDEAVIWTEPGSARLLQDILTKDYGIDLTGWRLWMATDISEDGSVIVGWGTNPQNQIRSFRAIIKADEERPLQVNSIADRPNSPGKTNCETGQLIEIDGEEVPECTLRAALEAATARGSSSPITFNIPGSGPHTIALQNALPVVPSQTTLDATTQPGYNGTPLLAINGSNAITTAFTLSQDESVIKGFSIGGFTGAGILINGGVDNRIEQCFIGVAPDGVTPTPNGTGIHIMNGQGNHIGDPEGETASLISGNLGAGVAITGEASRENIVSAAFIGTDISGTMPLPNQGHGILIDNAPENTIGGDQDAVRNLISGNVGSGVLITGSAASNNQVQGNFIGVNFSGNEALPNGEHGVLVQEGASENHIGGATGLAGRAPGNLISGNTLAGVMIKGSAEKSSSANRIQGNIIGLNAAGSSAIPNGEIGVHIQGAVTEVAVGGESAAEGNVIAGHARYNIWVEDQEGALPITPLIANNLVGTSSTGNTAITPGARIGVLIGRSGALISQIGVPGYKVLDNIIAGNNSNLWIQGDFSEFGEILGNNLGLLQNGNIALQDSTVYNLFILGGRFITIGQPGRGNNIGGAVFGMLLSTDESTVAGNHIGVSPSGNQARPNMLGIEIIGGVRENAGSVLSGRGRKNVIGAALDEEGELQAGRNIIAANTYAGIRIANALDITLSPNKASHSSGVPHIAHLPGSALMNLLPMPDDALKNLVTMEADSNVIIGNRIGLSASGLAMGNGRHPVEEQRSAGIEIMRGNGNMVLANEIGANGIGIGIYRGDDALYGPGKTLISGNYIGSRPQRKNLLPRPNQSGGIVTLTSNPVVIGIDAFNPFIQMPNYITYNDNYGIQVRRYSDEDTGEGHVSVRGNVIGMNDLGPYIVAMDEETFGGDIPGIPNFPELLSATVDSLMVKITGTAQVTGIVDFYSGEPDHYDTTIASRQHKTSLVLSEGTGFAAEGAIEDLALQEGAYVSATLSIGDEQQGLMTSHFSPAIRLAKATNVVQTLIDGEDSGELLSALGITTGRGEDDENTGNNNSGGEKSARATTKGDLSVVSSTINDIPGVNGPGANTQHARNGIAPASNPSLKSDHSTSALFATLHELAPEFNTFTGEAISAGGTHYAEPDTLFASHYWTLANSNLTTNDFYVCLDISSLDTESLFAGTGDGHPGGSAAHLVVLQRSHTGTPWQAHNTYLNHDSTAICARNLHATGDFAIGYNSAGETSGEVRTLFSLVFQVTDTHGNPVEGAVVTLGDTLQHGDYSFHKIPAGTYHYTVNAEGFFVASGSVTIHKDDVNLVVVLDTDNTSVATPLDEQLRVFPNPARDKLNVMFENPGNSPVRLSLLDMHGRQLYAQTFDQPGSISTRIDLQGLAPGIYMFRVVHDDALTVRKIQVVGR